MILFMHICIVGSALIKDISALERLVSASIIAMKNSSQTSTSAADHDNTNN